MAQVVFTSNLSTVLKATDEALARAAEIIGGKAESNAKIEVTRAVYDTPESPNYVRTGNLRNEITHTTEDNGHTVVLASPTEYAPYVELGTGRSSSASGGAGVFKGMAPRPFIRPAIEKYKDKYKQVLENELRRG